MASQHQHVPPDQHKTSLSTTLHRPSSRRRNSTTILKRPMSYSLLVNIHSRVKSHRCCSIVLLLLCLLCFLLMQTTTSSSFITLAQTIDNDDGNRSNDVSPFDSKSMTRQTSMLPYPKLNSTIPYASAFMNWDVNSYSDKDYRSNNSLITNIGSRSIVMVSNYMSAFIWKNVSSEYNVTSTKGFVEWLKNMSQSGKLANLKIGVERVYMNYFRVILQYYGLSEVMPMVSSFVFYSRNCRPRHVFEDFDVIITVPIIFFQYIRFYRDGIGLRKPIMSNDKIASYINPQDFVPIRLAPYTVAYYSPYLPWFMVTNSYALGVTAHLQYYANDADLANYHNFGNVTDEDLKFIAYVTGSTPNVDRAAFETMIRNTEARFGVTLTGSWTLQDYLASLYSSAYHRCVDTNCNDYKFEETDFWNIPVIILLVTYFALLFGTKSFLKPTLKRRLIIPYLPVLIIFFEFGAGSEYFANSCAPALGYVRMFVCCFWVVCYACMVIRFYYLRNLYKMISKGKKDISLVKRFSSAIIGLVLMCGVSLLVSAVFSIQGVTMFFDIFDNENATISVINISFALYLLIGTFAAVMVIAIDLIVNRRMVSQRGGFRKYLFFDDPFYVRLDLIFCTLIFATILIVIIIQGSVSNFRVGGVAHFNRFLVLLIYLWAILICGGTVILSEIISLFRKKKPNSTLMSELERYLKVPEFKALFAEYTEKELSLENYLCFKDLEDLEAIGLGKILDLQFLIEMERDFIRDNSIYELNLSSVTRHQFYLLLERCKKSSGSNGVELVDENRNGNSNTAKSTSSPSSTTPTNGDLYSLLRDTIMSNLADTHSRFIETVEFRNWYAVYEIQQKNNIV
ncbi:hypothetical protein C9374_008300 [Naegleria lovaniensis]|uniref:RGS domain-containing protein n=1 Tax=Naegleria lovaniensis TaxID=51637 RepID=A0AA88GK39_NAELO|nr:uncharacterized protein C9374_008300 [Naegleria lovaniensis]KAG2378661.1 hypothetical protein C9374_008300 [Naegleria lovaniensis]